jgi:hypothetical protein
MSCLINAFTPTDRYEQQRPELLTHRIAWFPVRSSGFARIKIVKQRRLP